jgi:hypothetical protein
MAVAWNDVAVHPLTIKLQLKPQPLMQGLQPCRSLPLLWENVQFPHKLWRPGTKVKQLLQKRLGNKLAANICHTQRTSQPLTHPDISGADTVATWHAYVAHMDAILGAPLPKTNWCRIVTQLGT